MYRVYLITNLTNDKVYVGQTKYSIWRRWSTHQIKSDSNRQGYFYNAVRKYGAGSFKIQQLAEVDTLKQAENLERIWIALLRSADRKYGYNSTYGGDGARHNEHTKEKLRLLVIGKNPWDRFSDPEEAKRNLSSAHKGKVFSEEHRKNISKARKNLSEEARRNISLAQMGKRCSEESRAKMSASRKGEGNARYLHHIKDQQLIDLYSSGLSIKAIGRKLQIGSTTVTRRLKKNNVEIKPRIN